MIRAALVLLPLVLSLSACKQGVGDRCQVDSDCQDDLVCELPVGGNPQTGGVCAPVGGFDMATNADFAAVD